ncbi:MAGE family-domain-containing protein [Crassisporium funariophilum]|nr:MAGE family-domain-containing protein [Crassisporium funariophilum]
MDMDDDANSENNRSANQLVRLALFTEHKRIVLRREDINKKAMGSNARAFNRVFEMAQEKLRNTFGMEMVELPSRAGLDQDHENEEDNNEARKATGIKKKSNALGSKTYIVRSCLDPILIEHAAETDADILAEEAGDHGTLFPSTLSDDGEGAEDDDDDAERIPKYFGSIISWSRADQLGSVGIMYVILALVLVNGRVITDMDLRRHLKTLHLSSNPNLRPVRYTASSTTRAQNIDAYLSHLLKSSYLDRQQIGGDAAARKGKKAGAGSKRLRTQAEDLDEGRTYEWRWGARAFCEVGEEYVAKFVAEFMVGSEADPEEEAGGPGRAEREREQEALMQKMYKGVEKAAGGKLAELK